MRRRAWIGFTLPSALLMFVAATAWQTLHENTSQGWVRGLKAAAVGVVAHATCSMARKFPRAVAALMGVNEAVVGLLLAALLGPIQRAGVSSVSTACITVAMFVMLASSRWPVPVLVLLAALCGSVIA